MGVPFPFSLDVNVMSDRDGTEELDGIEGLIWAEDVGLCPRSINYKLAREEVHCELKLPLAVVPGAS